MTPLGVHALAPESADLQQGDGVTARRGLLTPAARRLATGAAAFVIVVLIARAAGARGGELSQAAELLAHPNVAWLPVILGCEVLAYLAYASGQRRLLQTVRRPLPVGWLASLSVTAQSLSNFLPAGYVAANLLNFREIRQRGLSGAETAWVLLMSSVLYIGALAVLAIAGSQIAGRIGGRHAGDLRLGAYLAFAIVLAAGLVALAIARRRLRPTLGGFAPSKRRLAAAAGLFLAGWLADAACLVTAFLALGAQPPWGLLLMGYCAAQLVAFLPITPGGLGLVEGSLTLVLAAGGGAHQHVLAAVLLYRLVSYWGTLPGGALGYLALRRSATRRVEAGREPALAFAGAARSTV